MSTSRPIRVWLGGRGWCWDCKIPHPHPISKHVGYGYGYISAGVAADVARYHLYRHHKDVINSGN